MRKILIIIFITYVNSFSHIPKNLKGNWINKNKDLILNVNDNSINIKNDILKVDFNINYDGIKLNITTSKNIPKLNIINTFKLTGIVQTIKNNGINFDLYKNNNNNLILNWDSNDKNGNFTLYKISDL
jgi:hypothetical protein